MLNVLTLLKTLRSKQRALRKSRPLSNQSGFSLIEILVALTLLGIAGTFVAGKIFEKLEEGQMRAASIQMNALKANLKEFRRKCGFYPPQSDGLNALVEPPSGKECKNYPPEGFLEDGVIPVDPWEMDYVYKLEGSAPEIVSSGPDQELGTEDDISTKQEKRSDR